MPWVRNKRDGTVAQQLYDKPTPIKGWHKTDRIGEVAREMWKPGKGWVSRPTAALHAAIDAGHHADHPGRLAIDYAIKEMEARIILGTLADDGRLAREAKLRGVSVRKLAREVVAKADAQAVDLARITAKLAATKESG